MDFATVLVLAFAAGASTVIGGMLPGFVRIEKRVLDFCLSASTGVLISVIMLGVLPVALETGGAGYTALGFVLGGVVFMVTGFLFPHTYLDEKYEDRLYSILKTGSLIVTGILLYNFSAGLLLGSSFVPSAGLGIAVIIAIVLQNIPRGVSMKDPMMQAGMPSKKMMLLMLMSGVPLLVGALASFAALSSSMAVIVSSGLSFSCGAMLFVIVDQMMPIVKGSRTLHRTAMAIFIGMFIGVLLLAI